MFVTTFPANAPLRLAVKLKLIYEPGLSFPVVPAVPVNVKAEDVAVTAIPVIEAVVPDYVLVEEAWLFVCVWAITDSATIYWLVYVLPAPIA